MSQTSRKGKAAPPSRAFEALTPPIAEFLLQALNSLGYVEMTPVQTATIPLFNSNSDVVVEAPTGSGKTLSFLIPIVSKLLKMEPTKKHHVAALVLSPTRELAVQTHNVLLKLLGFHPSSAELLSYLKGQEKRPETTERVIVPQLVVGGTTKPREHLSFFTRHSPNVLVGTPGALRELLSSPHVNSTGSFEILVLDEADRLLDLGFAQDLQKILAFLPKQRRTGLFSASVNDAIGEIIKVNLRNPRRVIVNVKNLKSGGVVEERKTPASLQMTYLTQKASEKVPAMMQILQKLEPTPQRSIVFLSTCYSVKYFSQVLQPLLPGQYTIVPMHGKMEAAVRERTFAKFLNSVSPCILLTTDVAARGLDIPQVDLVINMEPPSDPKTLIHRAGRAGRAGRRGLAVTMLLPGREQDFLPYMEIRRSPLEPLANPAVTVSEEEVSAACESMRASALADREIYELQQRAFVSWVRFYSEHRAASIFRVADLDWTDLALQWGLLQLPKMPELKGLDVDRTLGLGHDVLAITFKDKTKEKKQQAEIAERAAAWASGATQREKDKAAARRHKNEAWSDKTDQDEVRVARREKKARKRAAEREATMTEREKAEKEELDRLLAEVRRQTAAGANEEFQGFGD